MIEGQRRRALVEIGAVVESSGLLYKVSVPADEGPANIVLPRAARIARGARLKNLGHNSDKLVRRIRVNAERIVGRLRVRIIRPDKVAVAQAFVEIDNQRVVISFKERAESPYFSGRIRRVEASADAGHT